MIDQQLIDSAKYIRKNFLNLNQKLLTYKTEVKDLSDFLQKKVKEIKEWNDTTLMKVRNKTDMTVAIDHLLKEINSIEEEEKKLFKKVESINIQIEKLKKEEEILYDTIKKRYPEVPDEVIKKELHSNFEK